MTGDGGLHGPLADDEYARTGQSIPDVRHERVSAALDAAIRVELERTFRATPEAVDTIMDELRAVTDKAVADMRRSRCSGYEKALYHECLIAKYTAWGFWGAFAAAVMACLTGRARLRVPIAIFIFGLCSGFSEYRAEEALRKIHED